MRSIDYVKHVNFANKLDKGAKYVTKKEIIDQYKNLLKDLMNTKYSKPLHEDTKRITVKYYVLRNAIRSNFITRFILRKHL